MTNINLDLAVKLDGSETHMIAVLIDSWGDKLVIPMMADTIIEGAEYFTPCAHCGNSVLDSSFESGMDTCDRCNAGPKHIWMPTKLQTETGTIELYKEDRTEEIMETMDKCVHWKIETCTGECWISDICTKRDELRKSAMLNMALTQKLPEDTMQNEKITVKHVLVANQLAPMEERIKTACENALETFWDVIVKHFPDSNDGAFLMSDMDDIALSWVKHWVECNVPRQTPRGDKALLADMHLHYADTWHLWHSGGGCMLAITDNVAVAGQYNYLVVSNDCVSIYEDKFDDNWMYDHIATWTFGDNPTVLMNQIDEFMGGNCLWDTGKLFDDIMTLGKSDMV